MRGLKLQSKVSLVWFVPYTYALCKKKWNKVEKNKVGNGVWSVVKMP